MGLDLLPKVLIHMAEGEISFLHHVDLSIKLPKCSKNLAAGFHKANDPRKIERITEMEVIVHFVI